MRINNVNRNTMSVSLKLQYMWTYVLFSSLCLILIPPNTFSQETITFEHLTMKKGLPNPTVTCGFQDRKGFLWFGTFNGIAKYDGYSIVSYIHDPEESSSIANAVISDICDDKEGNIWIGHSLGLDKFDPSTNKFSHYVLNPKKPLIDWSNHAICVFVDNEGIVWTGTGTGAYALNKSTGTFSRYLSDSTDPGSIVHNSVNAIYEDKSGSLWFGTGGGLDKFDKKQNKFIHYWNSEKGRDQEQTSIYWILCIIEDKYGKLWLGTDDGIIIFNKDLKSYNQYKHDPENSESLSNNVILSICEDLNGDLWISTKEGVDIFNRTTGKFLHNVHDPKDPGSISTNDIGQIFIDRSGVVWITCYAAGGVNKYTPVNKSITVYSPQNSKTDIFPNKVYEVDQDKSGIVWICTTYGIFKFSPENGYFESIKLEGNPNGFLIDSTGGLWLSSSQLFYKDPSGDVIRRYIDPEIPDNINVMCNGKNNQIWMGTAYGIVLKMNLLTKEKFQFPRLPTWIESIYESRNGQLWFGTRDFGLYCYDSSSNEYTTYTYNNADSTTISGNNVRKIFEDKNGNLWVTTNNSSLDKFDKEKGTFIRLSGRYGLPKLIWSAVDDDKGNLWLSTLNGIVKYSPETHIKKFYPGIFGYGVKLNNGELFFFSDNKIQQFHPDSLTENKYIPPVVITSTKLFEKPLLFSKEIRLPYNKNFISFEFAVLNYVKPELNQHAYMIEGLDTGWIYSGSRRFASYPNLQPGKYTFKVKGSNNDGIWNEEGTSLAIIISPPWWKTWWAYLSYFIVFAAALFAIRRYEMNRESLKNKIKMDEAVLREREETDKMKSRFFANISHEFRTPLTLIIGPAEKIYSETSENIKKDSDIIRRNSRRLLQLINQLLDLSKLEAGRLKLEASCSNIVSFVKGVTLSFESLSESKDITLKLLPEKEFIEMYFDKEKMMKILTNILSNAFKFTPEEGMITVSIKEVNGKVEIKIKDPGIGIPAEELPKLFDRFYQVDSSHTREYEGTGIGLALTKELVELHYGTIKVQSENEEGNSWTEFTLEFPLGKGHLKDKEIVSEPPELKEIDFHKEVQIPEPMQKITEEAGVVKEEKTIILIVEDNYDMREYIKDSLNKKEYQVEEAVNGEQGVRKAEKIIPDLIVSDLMMPKMDGNQLVGILKNNEKTSHIPIILLTAKAGQENKLEGLETGADDYLTKPFDIKELQVRIKNLINIRRKLQERFSKIGFTSTKVVISEPVTVRKLSKIDEKFMLKVKEVIDTHISEEEFSIEDFGSEVGMSRMQLHRKLKALTGKSATHYVRSVKLEKAKKMIEEKEGTISEIAYSLGFGSPAYFTRCFKEEYGVPPSLSST